MKPELYLPEDPLGRLCGIARPVAGEKRWFHGWSMLRYAMLGLLTTPGEPRDLTQRLFAAAEALRASSSWTSCLRQDLRFCLAAALLRRGGDGRRFAHVLDTTRGHFRRAGLRRSEPHEALAALVLAESTHDGVPTLAQVQRLAAVHAGMAREHRFLTGVDDYPTAALLAVSEESVPTIITRLERLYQGLRDLRFQRGNQLQFATHLLFFAPGSDEALQRRFRGLYAGFQAEGLWMNSGDYDEVAILAFLDHAPRTVVRRVLAHRAALRAELSPTPSKQEGFTLAANTALLELATEDQDLRRITDAARLAAAVGLIQANQAAIAAAASAATAGGVLAAT